MQRDAELAVRAEFAAARARPSTRSYTDGHIVALPPHSGAHSDAYCWHATAARSAGAHTVFPETINFTELITAIRPALAAA